MFTQILVLDFETRWASRACDWAPDGFSLSKITTEEYIRSPLFQAFGAGYKWYGHADEKPVYLTHPFLTAMFDAIDWSTTAVCCHNAQFDVAILTWIYGKKPAFIFDTLSMARALRGLEVGNSAAKLATDFGLPPKGRAVHSSDGMYTLTSDVEQELADYCKHDVWLCEQFLDRLMPGYPVKELKLIDATIRMFTEPQLTLDAELLKGAIDDDAEARALLQRRLCITDAELGSNDSFAKALSALGVDPPKKISPTTGKEVYAFAKNDALFQQLLNGDNEQVVLLCEARLKVKSTQERTRAQRFLDISGRGQGLLPVPINYAHTRTLRWGAAKGSNINMQNLKRGGKLRRAIMAAFGSQCIVGDLSQIEPRILAFLSDFHSLLETFKTEDAYATFGRTMFGIPDLTKETHPTLRQAAKSAMLGCFGAKTKVLTHNGWKPIVSVRLTDKLWDGETWVAHSGLIAQGEKLTTHFQGVWATEDHEILTERGWRVWGEVRTKTSLFQSALKLVNLPSLNGEALPYTKTKHPHTIPGLGVIVDGKVSSFGQTYNEEDQHAVTRVQKNKQQKQDHFILNTQASFRMLSIDNESSIEYPRSSHDVQIRKHNRIQTTGGAALKCIKNGLQNVQNSFDILSRLMAGTSQNWKLTESITTGDTNRAIYVSAHEAKTWQINAGLLLEKSKRLNNASATLSRKMQTYDIALAGPNNRYAILTHSGPIIAHNCGYRLGWASFASQLLVGFLGAPPVRYDRAFMKQLDIGGAEVRAFMEGKQGAARLERMMEIPHICTDEELLVHCVCAKVIIDRYRSASEPIVKFWAFLDKMIATVISVPDAEPVVYKCLTFKPGQIILPNGLPIRYDNIKCKADEYNRPQYTYWNGKTDKALHSGIVAENVTSGTARCVIGDGMLRVQRRYPCAMPVHDEGVWVVQDEHVEAASKWIKEQLIAPVAYLPGIPLDASVGHARRYGEAK